MDNIEVIKEQDELLVVQEPAVEIEAIQSSDELDILPK